MKNISILFVFYLIHANSIFSQETIFADYFDIQTNAEAGTYVTGKVHLKCNKDVLTTAIPEGYVFELISDNSGLFEVISRRENIGKMQGLLVADVLVKQGMSTPNVPTNYSLTIALKNGENILVTKDISIQVVAKTMWESLVSYYTPITISESRLYGRTKLSDTEVQSLIDEIVLNDGPITSINEIFDQAPETISGLHDKYVAVANQIGALGYAYANTSSSFYQSSVLRNAIYKSARAYMNNFPVFGDDIQDPMGNEIGDGYQGLYTNGKHLTHGQVTHQWTTIDPLGAPLVQVVVDMVQDVETGNSDAIALKESIHRFYQYFFAIVESKRVFGDPDQSWGDLSDLNYSNGAWTDANISHRMRSLMALGVLWADYNRPITYVPYWYDDYNDGTEFEGVTFGRDWSPRGVLKDIRSWCTKLDEESHLYNQSGFHPDGTMSHHRPHGASDVAMRAYGFEWMSRINTAIGYFTNTRIQIGDEGYQFLADRIDYTYRRMLYKQHLDYVVAGRSYYSPLAEFTTKDIKRAVNSLIEGKLPTTVITNEAELITLNNNLQANTHQHSESVAFWNADYLVHRKENQSENYYFSVKQKSSRVSGAEDFDDIRKSWHAGSGVFQLKVDGYEYSQNVLKEYDWHVLPGVTEEWRTDAMPIGAASDAGPGLNDFSGVLTNGTQATSAFFYNPTPLTYNTSENKLDDLPQYASVTAYKSYHMIDNIGTAIGTGILRKDSGQGKSIVTCIDQSVHNNTLYYSINGGEELSLDLGVSHNLVIAMSGPSWVFHENKGYLIFPAFAGQELIIKTGTYVNVTDTDITTSSNYILAINHSVSPIEGVSDKYHYAMIADVEKQAMSTLLATYQQDYSVIANSGVSHAVFDRSKKLVEATFYEASTIELKENQEDWIRTDKPAILIREELEDNIQLSVVDPLHDLSSTSIEIEISQELEPGVYNYDFKGIEIIEGETATVTTLDKGSKITIELPDSSDGMKYGYRETMLAGAPLTLMLPKKDTASVDSHLSKKDNAIIVYPVPITEETVIKTTNGSTISKIEITDAMGRLLYINTIKEPKKMVRLNGKVYLKTSSLIFARVYTSKGVFTKVLK